MLRHVKYLALNTQAEWLKAATIPTDYISGTPTTDKFTYDTVTESIHLNSSIAKTHYFQHITDLLKVGDIIEVECEFANLNGGYNGKIVIIDRIDKTTVKTFVSENSDSSFKKTKVRYAVDREAQYDVVVGIQDNSAGEIKMRNFRVKTYSSYGDTREYIETKNARKAMIEGNVAYGNKFIVRTDFASDGATITVNSGYLQLTWSTPFLSSKRPIYVASLEASAKNYLVRISSGTVNGVNIQFHNLTTGELIPIANLDLATSLNVSVMGLV